MDAALIASAALMGLAGGPHCAAMCGAACNLAAGASREESGRGDARALLALHAGRVIGYSALGGAVAASLNGLGAFAEAAPWLRPLWSVVHVAALALGVWLLALGRAPAWLSAASPRLAVIGQARPLRFFRTLPGPARSAVIGGAWAIVPCGLLQSALLVSALASSPASGALVMAAFGLMSTLGLGLAQLAWLRLRGRSSRERLARWPVRFAGALLAGASLFALWHGLGAAICRAAS